MRLFVALALGYGLSLFLLLIITPILRRLGLVSHPRPDRLSKREVPLTGGFALLFGVGLSSALVGLFSVDETATILIVSFAVGFIGFVDDIRPLPPAAKLLLQIVAAGALILSGIYVNIYFPVLGVPLSFLWFCGVCNAFNIIDNTDGVAAGVGAISALNIGVASYLDGNQSIALMSFALAGATAGVLPYNFPPARVYLGDSGSLSLGAALASLSVAATWREAGSLLVMLVLSILFIAVPLFDTVFVTVSRIGRGRPPTEGGVDHTAHRLLSAGVSPARVALLFYGVSAGIGGTGLLLRHNPLLLALTALGVLLTALLIAMALPAFRRASSRISVVNVIRRFLPATLLIADIIVFSLSFILSYLARFDFEIPEMYIPVIARTLPVIIAVKSGVFYLGDAYRKHSLIRLARNSLLATAFSIATFTIAFRFTDLSRGVFVIDFFVTLLLCGLVRMILNRLIERGETR